MATTGPGASLTVDFSDIDHNTARGAAGGNAIVNGSGGDAGGGGVYNGAGTALTISNSSLLYDQALGGNGGIGGNGGFASGGAIFVASDGSTLTISNPGGFTGFAFDQAIGGNGGKAGSPPGFTVNGDGGDGDGGAIALVGLMGVASTVTIDGAGIVQSTARGGNGFASPGFVAGSAGNGVAGAILLGSTGITATISNTALTRNTATGGTGTATDTNPTLIGSDAGSAASASAAPSRTSKRPSP